MDYKITRIDESEARVEFSGLILISHEEKVQFTRALDEVIDRYAI